MSTVVRIGYILIDTKNFVTKLIVKTNLFFSIFTNFFPSSFSRINEVRLSANVLVPLLVNSAKKKVNLHTLLVE